MSYRQEASTRVAYFFGAFIISAIVGLVIGAIVISFFHHQSTIDHNRIFGWTSFGVFAVTCAGLVYKIDQILNERFNKNP
jgi:MFS family permease